MSTYGEMPGGTGAVIADLRSDTVTRPSEGMRRAMAEAEVGDDVYGEDPTIRRLEERLADMLGKDAACLVASGTQSNLTAMLSHCGRGEEVITGWGHHVHMDEAAGASVLGGIAMETLPLDADGCIKTGALAEAIKTGDVGSPTSRLLALENTMQGRAIPVARLAVLSAIARKSGLSVHLDGARFFDAVTALGCTPGDLAGVADTVSICLSKGLGAPVGSVLVGPQPLMSRVRRNRKILGGGMRQAGILAAAGLYALDHNVARLAEDHQRAAAFGEALSRIGAGSVSVRTNMVFFTPASDCHADLRAYLAGRGVLIGGQSPEIRMVFHLDIDDRGLAAAIGGFEDFFEAGAKKDSAA